MLAERRRSPDKCLGPLDVQFCRKPRPLQDPGLSPRRGSEVEPGGKVLSQRRQQRIPPLITNGPRLVAQQQGLSIGSKIKVSGRRSGAHTRPGGNAPGLALASCRTLARSLY